MKKLCTFLLSAFKKRSIEEAIQSNIAVIGSTLHIEIEFIDPKITPYGRFIASNGFSINVTNFLSNSEILFLSKNHIEINIANIIIDENNYCGAELDFETKAKALLKRDEILQALKEWSEHIKYSNQVDEDYQTLNLFFKA